MQLSQWRLHALILTIFFICGLMLFRLFEKQVIEHQQFVEAATTQSIGEQTQPAPRGRIFARDKDDKLYPLAVSQWRYQLLISPRQVKNKKTLAEALVKDLPELADDNILAKIDNDKVYIPPILKNIEETKAKAVDEKGYAGVFLIPELVRVYPEGQAVSPQVVGFVGGDGEGKYGVEAIYDDQLRGKAGARKVKRDSLGRLIDVLNGSRSQSGDDLILTVDYNLQFFVEKKLQEAVEKYQADTGSIIIMDPRDGAIISVANWPKFDPNTYSQVKAEDQRVFLNRAASEPYEAGSVFKPLTMAAAIDAGLVTPETTEVFGKSVKVLDKEIRNAEDKVYGKETMGQVLENSDNVAMVWLSEKLGTEREREYFEKFGFGGKSGVDLVGEQAGYLAPLKDWNDLLRSTAAFGQGVSVNLIQLATAYSVIANGGELVTPHLAQKTMTNDQAKVLDFPKRSRAISPETASKIKTMLQSVVERGHGKRAAINGLKVGGKTGTAQIPNPEGGYYEDRHIGTFAGMFPIEDPKYVMVVRLDNPKTVKFAESSAAPTFGEIGEWMATYFQLR